jgi:beta-xylosidase
MLLLGFLLSLKSWNIAAQQFQSDNGDGTYTNPLIYADFPDPDVIRVDSVYYMVSTTMFVFPGVTILKSYDLVNWEYCSNAVPRMGFSPCYNLDSCNRYAHGQWATSLKYNKGKFYLLFITLDEGGFICSSEKPEGPWQITHLPRGFYDPGLFFDDNGKIYVAHGYSTINITELDTNFVAKSNDSLVFTGDIRTGLEGTHVYKINGYYYLYCTYGGGDGFQVALRSQNIYGPYEEKIVIRDNGNLGTGIHQGALVQTQSGEWWSVIFQDGGAFGRFPTLQPVTWQEDWPMVGVNGKGVWTYTKPNVGKEYPVKVLPTSDDFNSSELGMQWGWNHNPDSTKWSLTEKPGSLRLSTANVAKNLREARNTLTQRIFAYYSKDVATNASVMINTDNMIDGDIAGLAIFQDPYAYVGIKNNAGTKSIIMVNNGTVVDSVEINSSIIYLRTHAMYGSSIATFAYSTDNVSFINIGNELSMKFNLSVFTGNKFCLFNYATKTIGGSVDFDWFRIEICAKSDINPGIRVNDGSLIDTNRVTINFGDSVSLEPIVSSAGSWNWMGCNLTGSGSKKIIYPEKFCQASGYFTNACGMKSYVKYSVLVNPRTSLIDNKIADEVKVFPNPSSNQFITLQGIENFKEIVIQDSSGRKIKKFNNIKQSEINFRLDQKGIYLITLFSGQQYICKKIIVD